MKTKTAEKATIGVQNIPAELRGLAQWVNWKIEERDGKPTKVPYQPNGRRGSTTDPKTWSTFERVAAANGDLAGNIGFVFTKEAGYVGIDFDKCRDKKTGVTEQWADEAVRELDSYTEVSQSFTGWHVIVKGSLPPGGNRRGRIEMYETGRFFCMTGKILSGQSKIEERDLSKIHKQMLDGKFKDAPAGKAAASESEEDWRLIGELYKETHAADADALEKAFCEKYPERYAERINVKGPRTGKNIIRYSIERFFEQQPSDGLLKFGFNDAGNANRLLAVCGTELLYIAPWKKWAHWDGMRFLLDEKDRIRELARNAMKKFGAEAFEKGKDEAIKFALASLNSGRISNAVLEARDQRAVLPSELDINRDLLNFTNGTLNLRTLALAPHNPADRITRLVNCKYNPSAKCPTFLNFILQAVGAEQAPLLLRALGHSLTGHTSEKVTFFCFGETNTGKTTLLNLLSEHIFGEYSTLIMADSLIVRSNPDANTLSDLADLCGKRFVQTSETREGQRLDEATLKRITPGSALIRRTRKYELPFSFSATHKLWVDTNHELVISGTGDDVWGRVIPFKFGPRVAKLDRDLPAKLQSEMEGILALLCDEAKAWYERGLGDLPEAVTNTRAAWKSDADRVRRFVNECCDKGREFSTLPRPLYSGYNLWDKEGGEKPLTETMFFRKLKEMMRDFGIAKRDREYAGIDLQPAWKMRLENREKREAGVVTHAHERG